MSKYSSYILYLLISIFVVILYVNDFGPMHRLQRSIDDLLCSWTASDQMPDNIALVTIDQQAEKNFGDWPWSYDRIADLMAAVAGAEPKGMLLDAELTDDASQDSAGYTEILAGQLTWMNNVVLPFDVTLANFRIERTNNPKYLFNNTVAVNNALGLMSEEASLVAKKVYLPADKILAANPRLGFDYTSPDDDRQLRYQPLVVYFDGYYYPSVALAAAAAYLGIPPSSVTITEGQYVDLGGQQKIPITPTSEFFLSHRKNDPFATYSAATVLKHGFDFNLLKGRMVIIGPDQTITGERYWTPVNERTSELAVKATMIDNIINENLMSHLTRNPGIDMLVLFALGALAAFLLPRFQLKLRLSVLGGLFLAICVTSLVMAFGLNTLPEVVYLLLETTLFLIAAPLMEYHLQHQQAAIVQSTRKKLPKAEAEKSTKRDKKRKEDVRVREIVAAPTDAANINTAALTQGDAKSASRSAQNADAGLERTNAYEAEANSSELESRIDADVSLGQESAPAPSPKASTKSLSDSGRLNDSDGLKNLGRYQVTGILGKGAMGTVYKGIDPAINRPVALKTIRLDFVNDPAELEELKERLYREAQAAGKLSHPNIVTIYDVGSEGPLQYIAMEYLEGQTLEHLIKKKTKFNYRIISQIIVQMCQALEYAHERGIVHRDIKPANVMILNDYQVKVMDFGIARIDSNSMTKTGIAMGTPNYISPEQLRGLAIDRRADLFSLGVVMYELLLGRRPFKGENITSLIYSILHNEPDKPSNINPQIPLLFDHIIGKSLKKNPQDRYQKATEIVTDLADFTTTFVKS